MLSLRTLLAASALVLACSSSSASSGTSSTPTNPPASSGGEAPPATTATNVTPTPTTPPQPPPPTPAGAGSAASPELIARGHQRFDRVCGACHEDGSDGPRANLGWAEDRMRTMVRNGSARMRAIPAERLSDTDLDAVIAYLRSIHAVS